MDKRELDTLREEIHQLRQQVKDLTELLAERWYGVAVGTLVKIDGRAGVVTAVGVKDMQVRMDGQEISEKFLFDEWVRPTRGGDIRVG